MLVATIAARTGYSTTGMLKRCQPWALTIPPQRRAWSPGPDDRLVAELIRLYEGEQLSLENLAGRYGRSSD